MSIKRIDLIEYEHNKFIRDMEQLNYITNKMKEAYDFIKAKEEYKKFIYKPDFIIDKSCPDLVIKGDDYPTRNITG